MITVFESESSLWGSLPACTTFEAYYLWCNLELEHRHGSKRGRYAVGIVH